MVFSMNPTKIIVMREFVPTEFYLSQNYPNPFSERTTIKYCVACITNVKITVFSSEGEMLETLINGEKEAGTYKVEFSSHAGLSGEKRYLSSGDYYYCFEAGDYKSEKKMVLLR